MGQILGSFAVIVIVVLAVYLYREPWNREKWLVIAVVIVAVAGIAVYLNLPRAPTAYEAKNAQAIKDFCAEQRQKGRIEGTTCR